MTGDLVPVQFSWQYWAAQRAAGTAAACCPALELWRADGSAKVSAIAAGLPYATCGGYAADPLTPAQGSWTGSRVATSTCSATFAWVIPATVAPGDYRLKIAPGTPASNFLSLSGIFTVSTPYIKAMQPGGAVAPDALAAAAAAAIAASKGPSVGLSAPAAPTSVTAQCAFAVEMAGGNVTLACPAGTVFLNVTFADYGTFSGGCAAAGAAPPRPSSCTSAAATAAKVAASCAGRAACAFPNNFHKNADSLNRNFGDPCVNVKKRFVALYSCGVRAQAPVVNPPSEDSPEAYATFFAGESGTVSWSSNDNSGPPAFASTVTIDVLTNSTGALLASAESAVAVAGAPLTGAGLDATWEANFTMPTLPSAAAFGASWAFAATDYCVLRVRAADAAAPAALVDATPPFFCGPALGVSVALASAAPVSPGFSVGLTWSYPRGARPAIMGRPAVTLVAVLVPSVGGAPAAPVYVPWGVVMPPGAFGPARSNYAAPGAIITNASWVVPTRSALNAGCPALGAADAARAAWPAGAATTLDAELAALCALSPLAGSA
jgi:hypothetical protein